MRRDGAVHHAETGPPAPRQAGAARPPAFRDNPRLILAGIASSSPSLVGILALANRTPRFSPDFLTEFVLYALSAADLTMLAALVFVLARNIVKLVVERRRGAAVRALPRQARRAAARR